MVISLTAAMVAPGFSNITNIVSDKYSLGPDTYTQQIGGVSIINLMSDGHLKPYAFINSFKSHSWPDLWFSLIDLKDRKKVNGSSYDYASTNTYGATSSTNINIQLKGQDSKKPYIAEVHSGYDTKKLYFDLIAPWETSQKEALVINKTLTHGRFPEITAVNVDGKDMIAEIHRSSNQENHNNYYDLIDPRTGKLVVNHQYDHTRYPIHSISTIQYDSKPAIYVSSPDHEYKILDPKTGDIIKAGHMNHAIKGWVDNTYGFSVCHSAHCESYVLLQEDELLDNGHLRHYLDVVNAQTNQLMQKDYLGATYQEKGNRIISGKLALTAHPVDVGTEALNIVETYKSDYSIIVNQIDMTVPLYR